MIKNIDFELDKDLMKQMLNGNKALLKSEVNRSNLIAVITQMKDILKLRDLNNTFSFRLGDKFSPNAVNTLKELEALTMKQLNILSRMSVKMLKQGYTYSPLLMVAHNLLKYDVDTEKLASNFSSLLRFVKDYDVAKDIEPELRDNINVLKANLFILKQNDGFLNLITTGMEKETIENHLRLIDQIDEQFDFSDYEDIFKSPLQILYVVIDALKKSDPTFIPPKVKDWEVRKVAYDNIMILMAELLTPENVSSVFNLDVNVGGNNVRIDYVIEAVQLIISDKHKFTNRKIIIKTLINLYIDNCAITHEDGLGETIEDLIKNDEYFSRYYFETKIGRE